MKSGIQYIFKAALASAAVFCGCSGSSSSHNQNHGNKASLCIPVLNAVQTSGIEVLDVTEALNSPCLMWEDALEEIGLVFLETSQQSVLSRVNDIISTENYIYISDDYQNGSLAIFDSSGNFVKRLAKGGAPHELSFPRSMFFDSDSSMLYVYDKPVKISKFTSSGDFVSKMDVDVLFDSFAICGGRCYIVGTFAGSHKLMGISCKTGAVEQEWDLGKERFVIYASNLIQKAGDCFAVRKLYCDTVYSFKDDTLSARYLVKNNTFSGGPFPQEGVSFDEFFGNLSSSECIFDGYIDDAKDVQILSFMPKNLNQQMLLRSRKSGRIVPLDACPNSLLGSVEYFGVSDYDSNTYLGLILPERILPDGLFPGDPVWDGSNPGGLIPEADMERLRNVKPDDNPIIVLFKLKSEI